MKVRALRGVCIGPGRHLTPGETADIDPATTQFLVSIGAVARVDEPKPAEAPAVAEPAPEPIAEPEPETPAPPKGGKKEK